MKALFLIGMLLGLASCAEMPLKRCDGKMSQSDVMHCPEQVSGPYRKCEMPVDLYQGCVAPQ